MDNLPPKGADHAVSMSPGSSLVHAPYHLNFPASLCRNTVVLLLVLSTAGWLIFFPPLIPAWTAVVADRRMRLFGGLSSFQNIITGSLILGTCVGHFWSRNGAQPMGKRTEFFVSILVLYVILTCLALWLVWAWFLVRFLLDGGVTEGHSFYSCLPYSFGVAPADISFVNTTACRADEAILCITVGQVFTWTYFWVGLYIMNRRTFRNRESVTMAAVVDEEPKPAERAV